MKESSAITYALKYFDLGTDLNRPSLRTTKICDLERVVFSW
jgi:hypothetical protein